MYCSFFSVVDLGDDVGGCPPGPDRAIASDREPTKRKSSAKSSLRIPEEQARGGNGSACLRQMDGFSCKPSLKLSTIGADVSWVSPSCFRISPYSSPPRSPHSGALLKCLPNVLKYTWGVTGGHQQPPWPLQGKFWNIDIMKTNHEHPS